MSPPPPPLRTSATSCGCHRGCDPAAEAPGQSLPEPPRARARRQRPAQPARQAHHRAGERSAICAVPPISPAPAPSAGRARSCPSTSRRAPPAGRRRPPPAPRIACHQQPHRLREGVAHIHRREQCGEARTRSSRVGRMKPPTAEREKRNAAFPIAGGRAAVPRTASGSPLVPPRGPCAAGGRERPRSISDATPHAARGRRRQRSTTPAPTGRFPLAALHFA